VSRPSSNALIKDIFGVGPQKIIPLPQNKAPKNMARKYKLTYADKDAVVTSHMMGMSVKQIADKFHFGLTTVEQVIEHSKTEPDAKLRAERSLELASDMFDKIKLMVASVDADSIKSALKAGKIKDVAQSVQILDQTRKNILEDVKERLGFDNIESASDIDELLHKIGKVIEDTEKKLQRTEAKQRLVNAENGDIDQ
jgi:hypothetical protein